MTNCRPDKWSSLKKRADAREDALKLLLAIGGAGLGGGMLARGLVGANSTMSESSYDPLMHSSSIPTPLPVPIFPAPKKKKLLPQPAPATLAKAAAALRKSADGWLTDLANRFIPRGLPGDTPPPTPTATATQSPPTGLNPLKSEWGIPAAMLTAGTGLFGGWHLMGALADKTKTHTVDTAVNEAEDDYQKALAEQYRAALRAKRAEDTFGIDDLFDAYVKRADPAPSLIPRIPGISTLVDAMWSPVSVLAGGDNMSQIRGGIDAATLASTLGAGYLTHNWVKKRNPNKILEKAVQLRARQRQFTPSPFYAVPEQISEKA